MNRIARIVWSTCLAATLAIGCVAAFAGLTIPSIAGLSVAQPASSASGGAAPVVTLVYAGQSIGGAYSTIVGTQSPVLAGGEAIVVEFSGLANAALANPTMVGVTLVKQTAAFNAWISSSTSYGGYYLGQNATAGTATITPPAIAGGQDGLIAVYKITGMPATVTVRTAGKLAQAGAGKTITVVTAGTVQVGDLAFGYRSHENSVGSTDTLTPPAGWTSDAQYLNGTLNLPTDWSHLVTLSGGSTLSATWTSVDNAITDTSGAILVLAPN